MNEDRELHDAARRLGGRAADRLDVEATARAVVERLREPAATRPASLPPAWLRIAAAVVILVGGATLGRRLLVDPTGGHAMAHFVTDDLTDLSAEQLREVLTTLDETLDAGSTALPETDLDDLDAQQLRTVLRSLEG